MLFKQIISIFLASSLLGSIGLSSLVMFSFKVNQLEIIQKYCVNKDQPELKCDGKCYLSDQLSKTTEESNSPRQAPKTEDLNIPLFFMSLESFKNIFNGLMQPYSPLRIEKINQGFASTPFQPPKHNILLQETS